jgi:hypothetical protein
MLEMDRAITAKEEKLYLLGLFLCIANMTLRLEKWFFGRGNGCKFFMITRPEGLSESNE